MFVFAAAIYLAAAAFFFYEVYMPIIAALIISSAVLCYRARGLKEAMPEPYGRGKASTLDAKATERLGILLAVGGGLSTVGLMASVFFLPPEIFFSVLFGVTAGLPLSQVFFFTFVTWYERKSRKKIFFVNEDASVGKDEVFVKTVEMS